MRMMVAAVIALAALGGCNKAPAVDPSDPLAAKLVAPPSAAEKAVALKIVEAGGVLTLDDRTLTQVTEQQAQRLQMQESDLSPEQLVAAKAGIRKNLDAAVPQLKDGMVAALTEQFSKPELDLLLKLVTTKEAKAINEHMNAVMESSYKVADAVTTAAADKAVKELKAAWPVAAPKTPADAAPAPGATPAPAGAKPAGAPKPAQPASTGKPGKPTKPQ